MESLVRGGFAKPIKASRGFAKLPQYRDLEGLWEAPIQKGFHTRIHTSIYTFQSSFPTDKGVLSKDLMGGFLNAAVRRGFEKLHEAPIQRDLGKSLGDSRRCTKSLYRNSMKHPDLYREVMFVNPAPPMEGRDQVTKNFCQKL